MQLIYKLIQCVKEDKNQLSLKNEGRNGKSIRYKKVVRTKNKRVKN